MVAELLHNASMYIGKAREISQRKEERDLRESIVANDKKDIRQFGAIMRLRAKAIR